MSLYNELKRRNVIRVAVAYLTTNVVGCWYLLVEHGVHVHYLVNKENWHIEKVGNN